MIIGSIVMRNSYTYECFELTPGQWLVLLMVMPPFSMQISRTEFQGWFFSKQNNKLVTPFLDEICTFGVTPGDKKEINIVSKHRYDTTCLNLNFFSSTDNRPN